MKSFRRAAILGAVALMATGLMSCRAGAGDGYIARTVQQTPFSWTGFYVGVAGGYQVGATDLQLTALEDTEIGSVKGLASRGFVYDGRVGFDFQVPNTIFVLGAFGGYARGSANFDLNFIEVGSVLHGEVEPSWYGGVRGGVLINPATLVYVGYKYQAAKLTATSDFHPGESFSKDLRGHTALVGLEGRLTKNWSVAGEYGYTRFQGFNALAGSEMESGGALNVRHDDHTGTVRLIFRP